MGALARRHAGARRLSEHVREALGSWDFRPCVPGRRHRSHCFGDSGDLRGRSLSLWQQLPDREVMDRLCHAVPYFSESGLPSSGGSAGGHPAWNGGAPLSYLKTGISWQVSDVSSISSTPAPWVMSIDMNGNAVTLTSLLKKKTSGRNVICGLASPRLMARRYWWRSEGATSFVRATCPPIRSRFSTMPPCASE